MLPPSRLRTALVWGSLAFSLAAGGLAQAVLFVQAPYAATHWFRQAPLLLAVHLGTLGLLLLLVLGVLTQFMPMLMGKPMAWEGGLPALLAAVASCAVGVWAFLAGLRSGALAWVAGLGLTGLAALFAASALPALLDGGKVHRLSRATLGSALFYLFWTLLLGSLLAQGLIQAPLLTGDPFALIALHLHFGLVGFGCLSVFAVSYELLPMFNLAKDVDWRGGWVALGLTHGGLLLLAARTLGPGAGRLPARLWGWVLVAAVAAYLWQMRCLLSKALRRRLEANTVQFRVAWAALAGAAFLGAALGFDVAPSPGLQAAYVWLLLYGFLGGAIFSQLQKIVPLLAWYDRFAPLVGRLKVPNAADLLEPRLAWATPLLHGLSLVAGVAGWAWGRPAWIRLAAALGCALFLVQGALVLGCRLRGADETSRRNA
jgi:hypothetical protein